MSHEKADRLRALLSDPDWTLAAAQRDDEIDGDWTTSSRGNRRRIEERQRLQQEVCFDAVHLYLHNVCAWRLAVLHTEVGQYLARVYTMQREAGASR